jgi:hypothetical protein
VTKANLAVLTPLALSDPGDQADLLATVGAAMPGCVPYRFGATEPLRRTWTGPESAATFWAEPSVFWRGAGRPRCDGSIYRRAYPDDPHSHLDLVTDALPGPEGPALLRELARRFAADYGHLHALTTAEQQPLVAGGVHDFNGAPRLYVTPWTLRRWLPALYWATVLGPPYVALLGPQRIRTTPAYQVSELAPDRFYLQLTAQLSDVEDAPTAFRAARAAAVAHLGTDLFFDPATGEAAAHRAPSFDPVDVDR